MTEYSAQYGSWNDPEGLQHIKFGKVGVFDLYFTYNRKEAFWKAREVATKTGKTVTVLIKWPTGNGLRVECIDVSPFLGTADAE